MFTSPLKKGNFAGQKNSLFPFVEFLFCIILFVVEYTFIKFQGYNAWTQGLYGYSWDMMVHSWSTQHVRVKVVDRVSGEVTYIRPSVRILYHM